MLDSSDITIAELGSISKAADKLNMSQPTLSKRLTRLEQVLAIDLFHRHSAGMSPTPAANYIMEKGESIQGQLDAIGRHVNMLSNLDGGSLHIGVGPIIEQLYFPRVLLDFIERTNNVSVSIQTESAQRMLSMLKKGALDLAIGPFLSHNLPDEFVIKKIDSANIILVARAGHPLLDVAAAGEMNFLKLLEYPTIAPQIPASLYALLPKELSENTALITVENYAISKSVAMASDYITGGPRSLFEKELAEGTLVEIPTNMHVTWTSYCVMRPESLHIPAVKTFLDILDGYQG